VTAVVNRFGASCVDRLRSALVVRVLRAGEEVIWAGAGGAHAQNVGLAARPRVGCQHGQPVGEAALRPEDTGIVITPSPYRNWRASPTYTAGTAAAVGRGSRSPFPRFPRRRCYRADCHALRERRTEREIRRVELVDIQAALVQMERMGTQGAQREHESGRRLPLHFERVFLHIPGGLRAGRKHVIAWPIPERPPSVFPVGCSSPFG
jgi:hypothetical protein